MLPNVTLQPWLRKESDVLGEKLYALLCCIYYLLKVVNPTTSFKYNLQDLIGRYPEIEIVRMGFTVDWLSEPLWM